MDDYSYTLQNERAYPEALGIELSLPSNIDYKNEEGGYLRQHFVISAGHGYVEMTHSVLVPEQPDNAQEWQNSDPDQRIDSLYSEMLSNVLCVANTSQWAHDQIEVHGEVPVRVKTSDNHFNRAAKNAESFPKVAAVISEYAQRGFVIDLANIPDQPG